MSDDASLGAGFPVPDGVTAEGIERAAGAPVEGVDAAQPPPADMPPLELMVLDALVTASETVFSMRNCGEVEPNGLGLVGEAHLLDAVRSLLARGLVEVETESVVIDGRFFSRPLDGRPRLADADLRRYWLCLTSADRETGRAGSAVLDAYWDIHPVGKR